MLSTRQSQVRILVFVISFIIGILPDILYGQKQEVDAVYLKNGEVYRGTLLDQAGGNMLRIQTLCFNTRLFPGDEILRIEREEVDLDLLGRHSGKSHGYYNRTELGTLIGSGSNEKNTIFSAQMVNGYKAGRRYYPGIGVGIEFYEQAVIPFFADFTYAFLNQGVTPFLRGSFGYSIPLEDPPEQWGASTKNQGGILYSAGIGTSIPTGQTSSLVISILYRFQSLKSVYTEQWNDDELRLEKQYNRIALRIGFLFD